jgi:hypothetical protein
MNVRLHLSVTVIIVALTIGGPWRALVEAQGLNVVRPPAPPPAGTCQSPGNAVIAENCRTGNPREEWDVYGAGDPNIQGFATDVSVNAGDTIGFKIKSHSPRYRIDIYRMGWYGGLGARRVETIAPSVSLPQAQPECRVHPATRLVDCGNWRVSASWLVPANAVSGVYAARLVREDDEPTSWRSEEVDQAPIEKPAAVPHAYGAQGFGRLQDALKEKRASHIVFVVRNDAARSDLLVQLSDATWSAFNRYGGASLYGTSPGLQGALGAAGGGALGGAAPLDLPSRAYLVSANRPLANRLNAIQDQFFNAEYPLVRWLERNGFDVTYFAGVDTDRRGARLRNHRVFMTAGHDAYWTGPQRQHIEAARDAGVHLAFLSSSTGLWRARWEPSNDGASTPHRTLAAYKETHADGKIDSAKDDWTGTWRDSRVFNPLGPKPENAVVGTLHTVGGFRNDPLAVSADHARLRFWRNTSVAALTGQRTAVLGKGILGHELDEDLDNGVRPAGLVRLSATTIDNVAYLQDLGTIYDSGTATHHLTLYRAPSGSLVFSAGTAQYSWGLDNLHTHWTTGGSRVRPEIAGPSKDLQQATVNLLADMGVQPKSLQSDLVAAQASTDRSGPVASISAPGPATHAAGAFVVRGTAREVDGGVVAAVEVSFDRGQSWHPAEGTANWVYRWAISSAERASHGAQGGTDSLEVVSRAIDDSGNIGPASAPVRVPLTPPLTAAVAASRGGVR